MTSNTIQYGELDKAFFENKDDETMNLIRMVLVMNQTIVDTNADLLSKLSNPIMAKKETP